MSQVRLAISPARRPALADSSTMTRLRRALQGTAIDHAVRVIYRVCCLAGSTSLLDDIRADLAAEGVRAAIRKRKKTTLVFDWLIAALSYQGIANAIASDYMQRHGRVTWRAIKHKLNRGATCPKLTSYWQFYDCRYSKLHRTCAEPAHIGHCPCRAMTCATAASTRPPMRCTCSFVTWPTAI